MHQKSKEFLLQFKAVASKDGISLPTYREGTQETLNFLGFTRREVERIILSLSVLNYSTGPEPDRDRPGEVWEFGYDSDGYEIYIKLKLADISGAKLAKCFSFHIAKYKIDYPLREKKTENGV